MKKILSIWVVLQIGHCGILQADDTAAKLQALLEGQAPSIVSIRVVIRTEFGFAGQTQNQESRLRIQGVVVDENGLILISNTHFSADLPGMGMEIKIVPLEFKVIIEREEKEYDAFLVAKDTKLNLAFLQLKDLEERKLKAISLETSTTPSVGDQVVEVSRLDEGYDYAPFFSLGRISGAIKKPRRALMQTGDLQTLGLPVFTTGGEVVGVTTQLESGLKEEEQANLMQNPMQVLSMLRGGGAFGNTFILPTKSLKGVVEQAQKRSQEMMAEEEKKKAG